MLFRSPSLHDRRSAPPALHSARPRTWVQYRGTSQPALACRFTGLHLRRDLRSDDRTSPKRSAEDRRSQAARPDPREDRSEERRVGKERVSTCRSRGSRDREKKRIQIGGQYKTNKK